MAAKTAKIRCGRCRLDGTVQVTGRDTVATLGRIHSATQHGGGTRQAQQAANQAAKRARP